MNLLDLAVKIGVDDQVTGKIGGIANGIKSKLGAAAKTVGKLATAGTAAVAGGAIAITTAATNSYAQFEQLEGGVRKLYDTSSDKMMQYARNAYRTSGMSMNKYMEQATSFSAALINSLGGDVDKAADQTDKAMRLMSDNINTFGTNAEAVQNAIQGLSRENFTMLDNLKLGYAGTKEGMQQLIKDANEYAGLVGTENELTIESFSDMIDAIDIIQQKQHIWGTTALEASTTIEGSVNMTKAAWENFLTSLGTGNEDMIRESVTGIVGGIFGTWDEESEKRVGGIIQNVAPVVSRVGAAIITEIPSMASTIGYAFAEMVADALGMDTSYDQPIEGLLHRIGVVMSNKLPNAIKGFLSDALSAVFGESGREAVERFFETFDIEPFADAFERLSEAGGELFDMFADNLPQIGEFLGTALTIVGDLAQAGATVIELLTPFLPSIVAAFAAIKAVGIGSAAVSLITTIGAAMGSIQTFGGAITALVTILGGPVTVIAAIVAAIVAFVATNEDAREAIVNAWNVVVEFFNGIPAWWDNLWDGVAESVKSWVDNTLKKWEDFKKNASDKFEQLKTNVTNKAEELKSNVVSKVTSLRDSAVAKFEEIKGNITGAFNNARDSVIGSATDMYNGAVEKFNAVLGFVRGIPTAISNALSGLGSLLWGAGLDIIGGLWDGMSEAWSGLTSWVSGMADTIANLKGPLPYDKKVLVPNGLALMDSLFSGIKKGFENEVVPYVSGMALDIGDAIGTVNVPRVTTAKAMSGVTITGNTFIVREEQDIRKVGVQLYDLINREGTGSWSTSYSMA